MKYCVFILIYCFLGCNQSKKQTIKTQSTKDIKQKSIQPKVKNKRLVNLDFTTIKNDTLFVKGKQIIFTKPSLDEFEILKNQEGIYEVDSDFGHYTSKVKDSLKDNYNITYTDKRIIGIIKNSDTTYIDRLNPQKKYSSQSIHYAMVLVFNSYFSIYSNVYTDQEYYSIIKEYYTNVRYEKPIDYKYVISRNGLNIRQENGTIDGKFNNGDFVKILGYTNEVIEVEDQGKTIKGRWAIIKWEHNGKTDKRYVFEGFLGDVSEVKVYKDQKCYGFAFTKRHLYGQDDADLECLTKYLDLKLISKSSFDTLQSISNNKYTINKKVAITSNKDGTQNIKLPVKDSLIVYNSKVGYNHSSHVYYGDIEFLNQYLMFHIYPKAEDAFYTFIDRSTGKETFMFADFPYVSPDKKHIVSFVYDVYQEQFYIEVFKINQDHTIQLKYAFNFMHWLATSQNEVKWLSNNEFAIEIVNKNIYNGSEVEQPQYLKVRLKK